jgi:hypothetical protein
MRIEITGEACEECNEMMNAVVITLLGLDSLFLIISPAPLPTDSVSA